MSRPKTGNAQVDRVRTHFLRGGKLSPMSALNQYGIFRLAAIVYILRKEGMLVKTDRVRNRNGRYYAEYIMTPFQRRSYLEIN